jgi:type IV pilus assembly protein PilZ
MGAQTQPKKRQFDRVPLVARVNVTFDSLDSFLHGYSVNISRGGMFVATSTPLDIDTKIKLSIKLEHGDSLIEGEGAVVRCQEKDRDDPTCTPGMAIRFIKLSTKSREIVNEIVRKREEDLLT